MGSIDTKCNAVEFPWKEHCLESGPKDNANARKLVKRIDARESNRLLQD